MLKNILVLIANYATNQNQCCKCIFSPRMRICPLARKVFIGNYLDFNLSP